MYKWRLHWEGGTGLSNFWPKEGRLRGFDTDKGREGVQNPGNLEDVICTCPQRCVRYACIARGMHSHLIHFANLPPASQKVVLKGLKAKVSLALSLSLVGKLKEISVRRGHSEPIHSVSSRASISRRAHDYRTRMQCARATGFTQPYSDNCARAIRESTLDPQTNGKQLKFPFFVICEKARRPRRVRNLAQELGRRPPHQLQYWQLYALNPPQHDITALGRSVCAPISRSKLKESCKAVALSPSVVTDHEIIHDSSFIGDG